MTCIIPLLPPQVDELRPLFGQRGSAVLVAAIHPNGHGWQLDIHVLPGERRDAIQAACRGELKLPRRRKSPAAFSDESHTA